MTTSEWVAPGEQGFLVGETLYCRAFELGDAGYAAAWHFSPFPITRQRAEKILKEEMAKQSPGAAAHYIACRLGDDVPVGAIIVDAADRRTARLRVRVDPSAPAGAALTAEMLRIIVPWQVSERNSMVVWVELDGPAPEVVAAVEGLGMRPAIRFREAIWRDGGRHDQWTYELLHPHWVKQLGDPTAGIERGAVPLAEAPAVTPASRRVSIAHPTGPVPKNALLVSERLALRLTETEDAKLISRLMRGETETFWGRGRWLISPLQIEHWVEEDNGADPPGALALAVIRRETGDLIGEVGLTDLDLFHRTAETGSIIYHPALRGQGLGSEAKNLLLEYAFDHLGLHMITSFVWSFNTRSQAALRKQGYRDAGQMQWRAATSSGLAPNVAFDLLASEWRKRVGLSAA